MKRLVIISLLATTVLSACSKAEEPAQTVPSSSQPSQVQSAPQAPAVEKHPSVPLPVDYYTGEKGTNGQQTTSLVSKEWVETTLENEVIFERSYYFYEELDLSNYRLLKIGVNQVTTNGYQAGSLETTEKWDIVLGEASQRERYGEINSQLNNLSGYGLSAKEIDNNIADLKAEYLIAVPKEIADNPALQLKILKENELTGEFEFVYVDLN